MEPICENLVGSQSCFDGENDFKTCMEEVNMTDSNHLLHDSHLLCPFYEVNMCMSEVIIPLVKKQDVKVVEMFCFSLVDLVSKTH